MFETLTACQYYYKRVHQSDASSQCKLTVEGAAAPHRSFAFLTDQLNRHIIAKFARSHDLDPSIVHVNDRTQTLRGDDLFRRIRDSIFKHV